MEITIKKWGNCAAVRLPSAVLKSAHLAVDQVVEVEEHKGVITLRPAIHRRPSLDALIAATPGFERPEGWLENDAGLEQEAYRGGAA